MRRLLAVIIGLTLLLGFTGRFPTRIFAAPADFRIVNLNCTPAAGTPGSITIQNQNTGATPPGGVLGMLAVRITPPNGGTATTFQVSTQITTADATGLGYFVPSTGTAILQVGTGATQIPTSATPGTGAAPNPAPGQIALSTQNLLGTGVRVDLLTTTGGTVVDTRTCIGSQATSNVLYVSTAGFDQVVDSNTGALVPNTVCGPDLPPNTTPTTANPGPCFTIQNAITYANDASIIFVEFGTYEICAPIIVNKLVTISTRSTAPSGVAFGASLLNSGSAGGSFDFGGATPTGSAGATAAVSLAVLHSVSGGPVFIVTAQGYPALDSPANIPNTVDSNNPANTKLGFFYHAQIDGFRIGGASNPGAGAIELQNDSNTVISNNIIGGDPVTNGIYTGQPCTTPRVPGQTPPPQTIQAEDMGNAAGIIVQNSDHPDIYNDAILGEASFQFSPVLAVGKVLTGFGIVSSECLGAASDSSDGIIVSFDTIAKNVNAGIWICSDGGGGHLINTSTIRNNGRGVVLRDISNSLLDTNTISDNYQDAVVIYDASTNNTIQKNVIESSQTPGAAGIRLGGFGGGLAPLQTAIYNNTLMRNDTDVVITGARNTTFQSNVITASTGRTGVLIQVGSQGATSYTQPTGTVLHLNQIVSNGQCDAINGCAIRLDQYVTADVDATQNNFGLAASVDPNTVLWHKPNDPSLGFIAHDLSNLLPQPQAAATAVGAPGAGSLGLIGEASPAAGGVGAPAAGGPTVASNTATATPSPSPSPTPSPSPSPTPAPGANTQGTPGASPVLQTGAPGGSTVYAPGCNYVSVPASAGSSISTAAFLDEFQPVGNIFAAYRYDNVSQTYQGIYFSDPTVPVQVTTLVPGDVVSLCLTDNVQGPP